MIDKNAPRVRKDGQPARKPGPPKGVRYGGKPKGWKAKKTIEREREEKLVRERLALQAEAEANAGTAKGELLEAEAKGKKLMKEIGFEFAQMFAGLAAYYSPWPSWVQQIDAQTGKVTRVNANPNYDEVRFKEYGTLASQTARDFASYESPKLSAVMVGAAVVTKIQIEGGMSDDFKPPAINVLELKPGDPAYAVRAEDEGEKVIDVPPAPKTAA